MALLEGPVDIFRSDKQRRGFERRGDTNEINDLQRQIIELQQQNARLKDAIYKALFSSNLDECHRLLKEAVSKE